MSESDGGKNSASARASWQSCERSVRSGERSARRRRSGNGSDERRRGRRGARRGALKRRPRKHAVWRGLARGTRRSAPN